MEEKEQIQIQSSKKPAIHPINAGALHKSTQEIKEKEQNDAKKEKQASIDFQASKNKIAIQRETEKALASLKSLLREGHITTDIAQHILDKIQLSREEINLLFQKLEEIASLENINDILPQNYRISKEEYITALKSQADRLKTLQKIDGAITHLVRSNQGGVRGGFFSQFLLLLSTSLRTVQENLIDLKRALKKIESQSLSDHS